jgi:biotin synthase
LQQNFAVARSLPLQGCSVSPFIPGDETPLATAAAAEANWTLNSIAALRLMRPDWVIPAVSALNLMEPDGYRHGLAAGANLVTMNLTPGDLREDYEIGLADYYRGRTDKKTDRQPGVTAAAAA